MIIHKMADVNGMFKREYAFTLTKLGTAKEQMEKLDEALQCYTTAMQITKELLAAVFGEVPTQAVFAKDTKSRLFTKKA